MRLFSCPACGGTLYFDNFACACGAAAIYDPDAESGAGAFRQDVPACANRETIGCNWMAAPVEGDAGGADQGPALCRACALTDLAPDPSLPEAMEQWSAAEAAKRWVLANLTRWDWFGPRDPGAPPRFHMLAEETRHGPAKVIMGHADGVITINLAEADAAERTRRRDDLGEPYRTLTGHFRHEIAHYIFGRLSAYPGFPEAFRALFGDEREDYAAALKRHYEQGPPADWSTRHVTEYASAHPHEDWAESLAHLLHLTDITDSYVAVRLGAEEVPPGYDAYAETDAPALIERGCALGLALNHVNRAMGLADLYPFVLSDPAREKLAFAHMWLRGAGPDQNSPRA